MRRPPGERIVSKNELAARPALADSRAPLFRPLQLRDLRATPALAAAGRPRRVRRALFRPTRGVTVGGTSGVRWGYHGRLCGRCPRVLALLGATLPPPQIVCPDVG